MNRTHKGQKDSGPSPVPSWPLPCPQLAPPPTPPPKGGEGSPRYPCEVDIGCFCLLIGIFIGSNALCSLYAEGVLWDRNCAQMGSVKSVGSVREKNPQRISSVLSHMEGAFYFSQKNTDEQNTQGFTETLSQPISQNLTAIFGSNALWTLYAEGVLWARNVCQKAQWTLCALWEKKLTSEQVHVISNTYKPIFEVLA